MTDPRRPEEEKQARVTSTATVSTRVFLQFPLGMQPHVIYTGFTWAEDRATQGCDPSADPAAGMAGRRQSPQRKQPFWRERAKSQGFGDRVPN